MARLKHSIVLVGMMGAGKTAIGRGLADALDVPFWDSDDAIEQAANATISEVFARDGEAFFREREREVLTRLLAGPVGIVSTGGGAWIQDETRAVLARDGVPVWLKADLDLLWARVSKKSTRPLLQTDDPMGTLTELYNARTPIYAQAQIQVQARAEYSVETMTEQVLAVLQAHPELWEI